MYHVSTLLPSLASRGGQPSLAYAFAGERASVDVTSGSRVTFASHAARVDVFESVPVASDDSRVVLQVHNKTKVVIS